MLCEWRKMVLPEGARKSGERTTDYEALWQAAAPVFARRAQL